VKFRLIVLGVAAWVAVIGALAYHSLRNDPPTAREQTTIADAMPTVDEALARIAQAVASDPVVAVLHPYHKINSDCQITTFRDGARYERVLMVYTRDGAEAVALDRLSASLPKEYRAIVRKKNTTHTFEADAGNFVALRGGVEAPGRLRFAADTGCRPHPDPLREKTAPDADRAAVRAVLDALRLSGANWRTTALTCPANWPGRGRDASSEPAGSGGGLLWTVEAVATGSAPPVLSRLGDTAASGAILVQAREDVYAYRTGSTGVVVRATGSTVTVSATSGCAA
jgi:hypothetical protein